MDSDNLMIGLLIGGFIFLFIGIPILTTVGYQFAVVYPTEEVKNITVEEIIVRNYGSSGESAEYLFKCSDGNIYKNQDDFWYGKWETYDIYGEIKENHTYQVKVAGWRTGWRSEFPNIIEVQKQIS